MQPLVFEPYLRPQIWGGRQLQDVFGRQLPGTGPIGESWEISAHRLHVSRVSEGPLIGRLLTDLWRDQRREFDGQDGSDDAPFPWLIKFLDCQRPLSVQVHPDAPTAARLCPDESGKAEAWVVLEAAAAAWISAGLQPGVTRESLRQALDNDTVIDCLHRFVPQVGECIYSMPGTVHAMSGPLLLYEVQQTSDATFRLFDWNRTGLDGQPRRLHVNESLDAINWTLGPVRPVEPQPSSLRLPNVEVSRLLCGLGFQLDRLRTDGAFESPFGDRMSVWTVSRGTAELVQSGYRRTFRRGDTVLIPASAGAIQWCPTAEVELLAVTDAG